jgi:hypothetical protein
MGVNKIVSSYRICKINLCISKKSSKFAAAETLNKLEQKIDTTRMPNPAFKMVLTAVGKYAYRRKLATV